VVCESLNDDTGPSEESPHWVLEVAKRSSNAPQDFGIPAHDIVVDALVDGDWGDGDGQGIKSLRLCVVCARNWAYNRTCGASNISFGAAQTATASTMLFPAPWRWGGQMTLQSMNPNHAGQ